MPQNCNAFRLSRQGLMLAMISTAFAGPVLASTAAHVEFAVGAVTATGKDGRARPLGKGGEILTGDRVVTTSGRAQLRFTDGAYVSLQPNTTFEVREYRYDGQTDGSEKGIFGLLRGAMRTVTGLIGRVNRSAYQIQTPTATVGIRGTGGVIEVLADGTTRVTGNSGTWFIEKPNQDTLDVPAGTVGEAGPNPDEPPRETTEQPVLGPPQPIEVAGSSTLPSDAGDATFVAGDQVTPTGSPASIAGLTCTNGCELAYSSVVGGVATVSSVPATVGAYTFNAAGEMVAFTSAGQTKALTGSTVEFGTDGGVTAWGRWIGGATINGAVWTGFQTLPYVIGLPSPIADVTTGTATYSFNLIGATAPTDGTTTGSLTSATLVGNFGPSPKVDITMNVAIAGNTIMVGTGTSPLIVPGGGPYAPFSGITTTQSGSGCVSGGCRKRPRKRLLPRPKRSNRSDRPPRRRRSKVRQLVIVGEL
ncbi:MAG: FecR domain-containing protein [Gammaproteobacteria bacterium]|nr:FecR domain-containing protein [Gammaproteobacteria bacterium]